MSEVSNLVEFAEQIVREAGEFTKGFFRKSLDIQSKSDNSPVTQADLGAEQLVRQRIERVYPSHGIIGEEFGQKHPTDQSPYTWVLDPIDGTKSFIRGIPLYTTLLAVLEHEEPIIGIIFNPILDEFTLGVKGLPTLFNNKEVQVSKTSTLSEAWLQITDPTDLLHRQPEGGLKLMNSVLATRTWADGHGYALVARGEADIMVDPIMNLWDLACLQPIIQGAGGILTDIHGSAGLGTSAIAANPLLHRQVLELFKN